MHPDQSQRPHGEPSPRESHGATTDRNSAPDLGLRSLGAPAAETRKRRSPVSEALAEVAGALLRSWSISTSSSPERLGPNRRAGALNSRGNFVAMLAALDPERELVNENSQLGLAIKKTFEELDLLTPENAPSEALVALIQYPWARELFAQQVEGNQIQGGVPLLMPHYLFTDDGKPLIDPQAMEVFRSENVHSGFSPLGLHRENVNDYDGLFLGDIATLLRNSKLPAGFRRDLAQGALRREVSAHNAAQLMDLCTSPEAHLLSYCLSDSHLIKFVSELAKFANRWSTDEVDNFANAVFQACAPSSLLGTNPVRRALIQTIQDSHFSLSSMTLSNKELALSPVEPRLKDALHGTNALLSRDDDSELRRAINALTMYEANRTASAVFGLGSAASLAVLAAEHSAGSAFIFAASLVGALAYTAARGRRGMEAHLALTRSDQLRSELDSDTKSFLVSRAVYSLKSDIAAAIANILTHQRVSEADQTTLRKAFEATGAHEVTPHLLGLFGRSPSADTLYWFSQPKAALGQRKFFFPIDGGAVYLSGVLAHEVYRQFPDSESEDDSERLSNLMTVVCDHKDCDYVFRECFSGLDFPFQASAKSFARNVVRIASSIPEESSLKVATFISEALSHYPNSRDRSQLPQLVAAEIERSEYESSLKPLILRLLKNPDVKTNLLSLCPYLEGGEAIAATRIRELPLLGMEGQFYVMRALAGELSPGR